MNAPLRAHVHVPESSRPHGVARLAWAMRCIPLSLWHWAAAARRQYPGAQLRSRSLRLAARLAFARPRPVPATVLHMLAFWPFDSTRYIEFDFAWKRLQALARGRYLDVSSPRLFPILMMRDRPKLQVDLINPDRDDLALTESIVAGAGLSGRVTAQALRVEEASFPLEQFDAITCLSVLEHVPDPRSAVQRLWRWLRPGGALIVTLPVAARAVEQFGDRDPYGLEAVGRGGEFFLQYLYDEALLRDNVLGIVGDPTAQVLYGEREVGALRANLGRKADLGRYPYWAEPTLMSQILKPFTTLSELPGEGVLGLEFVKHD